MKRISDRPYLQQRGHRNDGCKLLPLYRRSFVSGQCVRREVVAFAQIDKDALPLVEGTQWDKHGHGFVRGQGDAIIGEVILRHFRPELFPLQPGQRVGHRNGDSDDCRLVNLYVTTGPAPRRKKHIRDNNESKGCRELEANVRAYRRVIR